MHFVLFWFLTGDLEAFKKQAFVLKEGVEYKIKISFKVRAALATVICTENKTVHYLSLLFVVVMKIHQLEVIDELEIDAIIIRSQS